MEGGVPLPPIPKHTEKFPESQFNDWGFAKLPLLGPISELSSIYPDNLFYLGPTCSYALGFFWSIKKGHHPILEKLQNITLLSHFQVISES